MAVAVKSTRPDPKQSNQAKRGVGEQRPVRLAPHRPLLGASVTVPTPQ